jgi:hypothetical protein
MMNQETPNEGRRVLAIEYFCYLRRVTSLWQFAAEGKVRCSVSYCLSCASFMLGTLKFSISFWHQAHEMGGALSTHGITNTYGVLVRDPDVKRPLGIPRR